MVSVPRTKTPEYQVWASMKGRCLNPGHKAFKDYGARGIKICPAWTASFDAFLADVGRRPHPGLSLDRIDNERGYEPGNCRWATAKEQAGNRRHRKPGQAMGVPRKPCAVPLFELVTEPQARVLCAIGSLARDGVVPSLRELAARLGLAAPSGVAQTIAALRLRGLVTQESNRKRTLRLTGAPWCVLKPKQGAL